MKRYLRSLHKVLGLTVGLWAALTALTGSALVFSDKIDATLNPHLLRVVPQAGPRDLDGAVAAVRTRFPDEALTSVSLPRAANAPFVFRLGRPLATEVFVDPYTAEVLGARAWLGGVLGFLWDLHVHLLAGRAGETVAGFLGLLLMGLVVAGLALWWPRRGRVASAFRIRRTRLALPLLYDLHKAVGALAAPLILIIALTGAMLVFHQTASKILLAGLGGPALSLPKTVPGPEGAERLPPSRLLASGLLSGAQAVSLRFPAKPDAPAIIRQRFPSNTHPNGRTFVAVNPYTGEVAHVHDWRKAGAGVRVNAYKYPLHIGAAFGLPGRIAVLIMGLVPALMFVSGGYVWWRRRRQSRK